MVKISLVFCILALWVVSDQVNCKVVTPSHHTHAPAPSDDHCSTLMFNMAECLSFVTSGSNISKPEGGCCNGLKTDPACLCEAFKNSAKLGIDVNITKALTLPSACRLKAPPLSDCDMSPTPAAAPGQSPGQVTPSPAPTRGSDNHVPAPAPNESGSPTTSISLAALLVSLVVASCSYF